MFGAEGFGEAKRAFDRHAVIQGALCGRLN